MTTFHEQFNQVIFHMCCRCMKGENVVFQDAFSLSARNQKGSSERVFVPICHDCSIEIKQGKEFWRAMLMGSCTGCLLLFILGIHESMILFPGIMLFIALVAWMKLVVQYPFKITSQRIHFSNKRYQRLFDEADLHGRGVDGALFILPQMSRKNKVLAGILYDQRH